MRVAVALACCLALHAAVQAASPKPSPYGLLQLEGPISPASLVSTQGKKHHHSHPKKKHYEDSSYADRSYDYHSHADSPYGDGPYQDTPSYAPYEPAQYPQHDSYYPQHDSYYREGPHDSYWDPRYQAKAELIACIKAAAGIFDREDSNTWEEAGAFLAHCLEQHLGGCHDLPELPGEMTSTLPYILFLSGLETLLANPSGLEVAKLVFSFYLVGGMGDAASNPYYTGLDSCSAKLTALLQSGAYWGKDTGMFARLAKVVIKVLEDALKGTSNLSPCVKDIPAVLLALASTYCPASGSLYNPYTDNSTECKYIAAATYEDSSSALLAASIWTGLFLSNNPRLMTLGYKLAFDMNLLALAATYPNDFTACSGGGLQTFLDEFPGDFSGPLGSISGMQVKGIQEISGDATNVLCGAIGLMSGKGNWDENVLWQGTANIANAIFKTIQLGLAAEPSISISAKQVTGLCAVTKAVWSFATNKPAVGGYVIVTVPAPVIAPTEISKPCYTAEPQVGGCGNPGNTFEGLAEGHSLDKTSPTAIVCNWDETSRLSDSSKSSAASVSDNIFRLVGAGHRPGARKSG